MSSSTPFAQGKATVESPSHHDYFLECMIPYIPSKVDYTPDLSALKPMPQVAFNCFSELQQDINSHAQRLLSKQPRNKMVPSQNAKYNTAISSAMKEIVDRSKAKWEEMATQMNDSTFASEDLEAHSALMSRAASNYFTLSALYTEHNGPTATTKEGRKAWATSAQKERNGKRMLRNGMLPGRTKALMLAVMVRRHLNSSTRVCFSFDVDDARLTVSQSNNTDRCSDSLW